MDDLQIDKKHTINSKNKKIIKNISKNLQKKKTNLQNHYLNISGFTVKRFGAKQVLAMQKFYKDFNQNSYTQTQNDYGTLKKYNTPRNKFYNNKGKNCKIQHQAKYKTKL